MLRPQGQQNFGLGLGLGLMVFGLGLVLSLTLSGLGLGLDLVVFWPHWYVTNQPPKANSVFRPSGVGK